MKYLFPILIASSPLIVFIGGVTFSCSCQTKEDAACIERQYQLRDSVEEASKYDIAIDVNSGDTVLIKIQI